MPNSFKALATLQAGGQTVSYYRLDALREHGMDVSRLPFSLKVLLENLLRHEDGVTVTADDIKALARWNPRSEPDREIAFRPSRVLLQDFTGVPAIVDLAAMRDAMKRLGGDPRKINPLQPVELVIDHSVQVDEAGTAAGVRHQRRAGISSGTKSGTRFCAGARMPSSNFRVVPPDTGIVHQVNLEYLARVVFGAEGANGSTSLAYPDTLVGTDSHTTMINGLGVLGWGVGGIEAEAAMLGQPVSMLVPQVVGFKLTGSLPEGATATDLVLTVTQMLRKRGVVGKFVEYFGSGLAGLPLADRATIANMAPEYGATCGLVPDRRGDDPLPRALRPAAGRDQARRSLRQGPGHVPLSRFAGGRVFRHARARLIDRGTEPGGSPASARPGAVAQFEDGVSNRAQRAAVGPAQEDYVERVVAGDRAVRLRGRGYSDRRCRARRLKRVRSPPRRSRTARS